ncbi:clpC [Symbiodinium necroappetens]|uniref:ClpC protein n=1 Tax=Symbiodinium necroappetens TaxID=1628268 RepID=A0A813CEB4_9DINO|nr:clpC [Symbiodinium necroappetens]
MGASQSLCRAKAAGCDWEGAPAPIEVIEAAEAAADGAAPAEQDAVELEEIISRFQAAIPGATSDSDKDITARQDSKSRRRDLLNRALVPDTEIMRGISLQSTLVWGGRLWRLAPSVLPEQELANRWLHSTQVEHFDVFLSHTWRTKGLSKFFSLSLQCGWVRIFLAWFLAILILEILAFWDILSPHILVQVAFEGKDYTCPFGAWGLYLSNLVSLVVLVLAPGGASKLCFLDVASINQADNNMKERGIFGLGGFLKVSQELRILWSRPYLSRLWCIFEIAAYRFANPRGCITFAPLFLENTVVKLWLGNYVTMVTFMLLLIVVDAAAVVMLLPAFLPLCMVFHFLRKNLLAKRELFAELRNFDLNKVACKREFDRKFIYSAIEEWYGSQEAFTAFVRGPLKEELLAKQADTRLPLKYTLIILTPVLSVGMDGLLAFVKGGMPLNFLICYGCGILLGLFLLWSAVTIRVAVALCDRLAAPYKPGCFDYLQSVMVFLASVAVTFAGIVIAARAYVSGEAYTFAWLAGASLACWATHGGCKCLVCSIAHSTGQQALSDSVVATSA